MQGGDLRSALSRGAAKALCWHGHGKGICLDVVRGLAFLESCGIAHQAITSKVRKGRKRLCVENGEEQPGPPQFGCSPRGDVIRRLSQHPQFTATHSNPIPRP